MKGGLACLLTLLLGFSVSDATVAAETDGSPHENYRVLEWNDLVPEGWEPPLVPKA